MSEGEAREALKQIRLQMENSLSSLDRALNLASAFDASEGWKALGYRSLAACLAFELQMTRSRAYDLIDRMRASILVPEEATPSRDKARAIVRPKEESVAAATESDQLTPTPEREIIRTPAGGDTRFTIDDLDEGQAIYQCRHCQRSGTIEQLSRCLTLLRGETE